MELEDVLALDVLRPATTVAGKAGLSREVRWVHVVDIPNPFPWLRPRQLLLTTGYGWPQEGEAQREMIRRLEALELAGVCLAVPHFFPHFPSACVEEADVVGLPLIEVPWQVPFTKITEEAHRVLLGEQYEAIRRADLIHRELTRTATGAPSLAELASTLGRLIEHSVTIEDRDGRLLAASEPVADADGVRTSTLSAGATPPGVMERLRSQGVLERVARSPRPVKVAAMPELGMAERVAQAIRVGERVIGVLWVMEAGAPLSDLDLRAAEHAAVVAALHIAHQRQIASLEGRFARTFFDTLLEGTVSLDPQRQERARLFGFDAEAAHRVGILLMDEVLPLTHEALARRDQAGEGVKRIVSDLGGTALVSFALNRVVFLLPPESATEPELLQVAPNAAVAIGGIHSGSAGVHASFLEASSLLEYLRPGTSLRYEHFVVPRVLLGDEEARARLVEAVLGPLRVRGGERLARTLLAWAEAGFEQRRTAHKLGLHVNSVRYRLDRIAELSGLVLDDPETRFRIQLARHVLSAAHNDPRLSSWVGYVDNPNGLA